MSFSEQGTSTIFQRTKFANFILILSLKICVLEICKNFLEIPQVFYKKGVLKILQNSQENTWARVSFLIKLQDWGILAQMFFSCEFCEFFKKTFFTEQLLWLLLSCLIHNSELWIPQMHAIQCIVHSKFLKFLYNGEAYSLIPCVMLSPTIFNESTKIFGVTEIYMFGARFNRRLDKCLLDTRAQHYYNCCIYVSWKILCI